MCFFRQFAHAVPARLRHVGCPTERQPDILRVLARIQSLNSRSISAVDERQITGDGAAIDVTELTRHRSPEFAQSHRHHASKENPPRGSAHAGVEMTNAPAEAPGRLATRDSVNRETRVEVCDQIVGNCVGNRVETFDDREAISNLTHNHRYRCVQRLGH